LYPVRTYLWDFERTEADVRPKLDNQIVAKACCGPTEFVDLIVGEPDFALTATRQFDTHRSLLSFRAVIYDI
jgi:hypothetical protein